MFGLVIYRSTYGPPRVAAALVSGLIVHRHRSATWRSLKLKEPAVKPPTLRPGHPPGPARLPSGRPSRSI